MRLAFVVLVIALVIFSFGCVEKKIPVGGEDVLGDIDAELSGLDDLESELDASEFDSLEEDLEFSEL